MIMIAYFNLEQNITYHLTQALFAYPQIEEYIVI